METGERAVTGAEVIHGKRDAESAEAAEDRGCGLDIVDEDGLRHFKTKLAACGTGLEQERVDVILEAGAEELARGKVYTDAQRTVIGVFLSPGLNLRAGLSKAPVSDGVDEAALLCVGNELHGGDEAALGMAPANEGFKADDAEGFDLDL